MPPAIQEDARGALWGKNEATLSGGAYGRPGATGIPPGATNVVHERNLSRYSIYKGARDGSMAMGIVEGMLSLLAGNVGTLSCDGDALAGRVKVSSLSSPHDYDFTWDARDPARLILGGFPRAGASVRPTYHAAIVGLVAHWTAWHVRGGAPGELIERWWTLLTEMDTLYPRRAGTPAWTRAQVADSCHPRPGVAGSERLRDAHEAVADSLWLHLKYRIPDAAAERALLVQHASVLPEDGGYLVPVDPALLLAVPTAPMAPPPAPVVPGPDDPNDPDLALVDDPEVRRAVEAADATIRGSGGGMVETADVARIRAALQGEGAVFLLGPAGQGKTEWAKRLAAEYLDGFELIQLTGRLHEEDLYGTNVQDCDGRWALAPGPVTRFAQRVADGQRLALILDEFPRAHASLRDGVMALINTHTAADLAEQGLPVPCEPGPYHIVDVPGHATYILPSRRVKIVATGNLGESYRGLDLSDPAFLDRWTYWLHLAELTPDELRRILARHTGLPPAHALLGALLAVAREVDEYQAANAGKLRASVTLRTLIRWGTTVTRMAHAATPPGDRPAYDRPLVDVARGQWLDKACPLRGDGLDPTTYAELLEMIERAAGSL